MKCNLASRIYDVHMSLHCVLRLMYQRQGLGAHVAQGDEPGDHGDDRERDTSKNSRLWA